MDRFSPEQTYRLITDLGIDVKSDTSTVWTCLCPFHGNTNTPAFAVNKTNGTFYCFNLACGASGSMVSLVKSLTGKNEFAALRMIARVQKDNVLDVPAIIKKNLEGEPLPTFKRETLEGMEQEFWKSQSAQDYMYGRGFTKETLEHFHIGYSPKQHMIGVPMHDVMGNPVGLIGRTIEGKRFKNSKHLPKSRIPWNIHRAKRHPLGIINESSFDAIRVWQATGYEAMATLGSSWSEEQAGYINKYFTHLVIFTDDDEEHPTKHVNCRKCRDAGWPDCQGHNTGLELGLAIADSCRGVTLSWAHLDSLHRFDGLKDAGDMTESQIRYAIDNSVPHSEMLRSVYA
jgi:DNA primase